MRAFVLLSLLALVASQTTEGPNECACEIVAPEVEDYIVLYSFSSVWEGSCDKIGEELCRKQCRDDSNALEENGGWMAPASEGDNMTIGDVACENLGRDETLGIESQLYSSVCDLPYHEEGHGIRDLLCCEDGLQVECLGPITTLPPMLWDLPKDMLKRRMEKRLKTMVENSM
ncbi:hypothetical protein FJT64_004026 [Amphibalanus amphitrite]|uniref:Uncharacterized protein n=1 Tax=Amphibalanus amphitrite TaxID=1232801 RepID=A0A6A4VV05_AMPAM|nr:hypothetical protein FJT64_004026 [Amphibalanus amphitrite]